MDVCTICSQESRKDCYGGEMENGTDCPGWFLRARYPVVSEEMVKRAAEAFVKSANHEVHHLDIRAALEAVM